MGHARARKIPAQLVEDEDYQLRHERVAGIDIAKAKADVCTRLPPARDGGRRASRLEEVPATAREILALAGRLLADRVELVVMEATSDYWRIWFYLLEAAGLTVQLVNPAHARQLAGRPKTDRLDAQWLARLAEMGLLRPSFVPPPEIRALRDLTRTRVQLVRDRTREWQRLENSSKAPWSSCHRRCRAWPGPRPPATSWRRSPTASATRRPWPPWPRRADQGRPRRRRAGPGGHAPRRAPSHADPHPPRPHHVPGPLHRRGRGPDRRRPGRDPRRLGNQRRRRPLPGPRPRRRGADRDKSGSRSSPASARSSPWRSSPRPAWI